jgi:hypothetical protein
MICHPDHQRSCHRPSTFLSWTINDLVIPATNDFVTLTILSSRPELALPEGKGKRSGGTCFSPAATAN